jgi:hypothetical protein
MSFGPRLLVRLLVALCVIPAPGCQRVDQISPSSLQTSPAPPGDPNTITLQLDRTETGVLHVDPLDTSGFTSQVYRVAVPTAGRLHVAITWVEANRTVCAFTWGENDSQACSATSPEVADFAVTAGETHYFEVGFDTSSLRPGAELTYSVSASLVTAASNERRR